jgi:antagonist of KipI
MSSIEIVSGGFLTTVQDLGRPGRAAIGVSASGAADPIALRVGNRLVGNSGRAAALEMTLVGATVRFSADTVFALTGADAGADLSGRAVPRWHVVRGMAGDTLTGRALRGGARAYLCVRGGLEVAPVFGSASTHLASGLGGFQGRRLAAGDRLTIGAGAPMTPSDRALDPSDLPGYRSGEALRVTAGPQASWFHRDAGSTLASATWRVAEACDRVGIRLEGPPLQLADSRELVTEGVALGAVQVPPDGRPIVLFVEHQTSGGYPKLANVASVDMARLGQLRPRDAVRFHAVSFDDAVTLARAQDAALRSLLR